MSTICIHDTQLGNVLSGGIVMPTFGGIAVSGALAGSATAFGTRERHLGAAAAIDMDASMAINAAGVWADVVATEPKRTPGTQVWSPPT